MEIEKPIAKTVKKSSVRSYLHLLLFSLLYTVLAGACWFGFDPAFGRGMNLSSAAVAFGGATGILIAVWAVFGLGGYLTRVALSFAIGAPVIIANAVGFWTVIGNPMDEITLILSILVSLLVGIVLTVAIQIPFWFIRFIAGWRLAFEGDELDTSVPLRELFLITFVFGLAFVAPQIADRIVVNAQLNKIKIGSEFFDMEAMESGSWAGSSISVTEENIESVKSKVRTQDFYQVSPSIYRGAVSIAVISLVLSPIILIVFRVKRWYLVICYTALFGLVAFAFSMGLSIMTMPPGAISVSEQMLMNGLTTGTIVFAFAIPLAVSRRRGFVLHSSKTRKLQMQSVQEVGEGVESEGLV